jgi:hypothetical protein
MPRRARADVAAPAWQLLPPSFASALALFASVSAFDTAHCGVCTSLHRCHRGVNPAMAVQWASACESAYSKSVLQRNSESNAGTSIEVSHHSIVSARLPCNSSCDVVCTVLHLAAAAQAVPLLAHLSSPQVPQLVSSLILTIVGACIRFLRWRKHKIESNAISYTAHDFSSALPTRAWSGGAASGGGVSHDGGWPQDRFASLSVVAGLTGAVDAVFWGVLYRNAKYAGFSEYYSSSFAAALLKVNEASNAVSGATWFVAFNAIALNFAQLILIERLIGALVVAARLHAVADDADRGHIIKWVLRYPRPMRFIIIAGGAISVAARTGDLVLGIVVSRTVLTWRDLNVSSVAVMQVWGLGFGVRGSGFGVWGLGFGVWDLGCWLGIRFSSASLVTQGLTDISPKEDARRVLAVIGRSAEITVLICILFGFVAAGALLYAALHRVGSSVKRLQHRIAFISVLFFSTFIVRFVCESPPLMF